MLRIVDGSIEAHPPTHIKLSLSDEILTADMTDMDSVVCLPAIRSGDNLMIHNVPKCFVNTIGIMGTGLYAVVRVDEFAIEAGSSLCVDTVDDNVIVRIK
jgi:hypothetical protein